MSPLKEKFHYFPLIVVFGIAFFASMTLQVAQAHFHALSFMNHFMGLFFLLLAMFKLFDLPAFVDGFQKYDLIAQKNRLYAYLYPFIELTLGGLFLSGLFSVWTNIATAVFMFISAAGIFITMKRGHTLKCACLGTVLNVPLSTVSLIENLGMGAMALFMLFNIPH